MKPLVEVRDMCKIYNPGENEVRALAVSYTHLDVYKRQIYLVPAVRKYPSDFSEPFADQLLAAWNEMFSVNLGKASYEDIAGGFKRKLCYVTTAICESLGKEADCYELRLLKDYREDVYKRQLLMFPRIWRGILMS